MRRKRNSLFGLLISFLLVAALLPTAVFAIDEIDTSKTVQLTISYKDGSKAISGARFSIYKVADAEGFAHMTLTEEFEAYRDTVVGLTDLDHLTQDQWLMLASSLKGYVLKDALTPFAEGETDADGVLSFSDFEIGLYLVIGSRATTEDYYTYSAVPFMLFLPARNTSNDEWTYQVTAIPKFTKDFYPPEAEGRYITRKVLKIWDDDGYESLRLPELTVQLLRNGEVYDTQILSSENNWRYAWDNLPAGYEWDVIEKDAEGYAGSTTRSGITFTITNKYLQPIIGTNLPIQKRIPGDKPGENSTFTFLFSAEKPFSPMPEGSDGMVKEITITGAGSAEIGEITFETPGTYVYTIKEKDGGIKGYTYDSTVYTVTFEVSEEDGELTVKRTIKDDAENPVSAIEFSNPYKTPGGELPYTGILWWPVPILFCAGLVFVIVGFVCRKKNS